METGTITDEVDHPDGGPARRRRSRRRCWRSRSSRHATAATTSTTVGGAGAHLRIPVAPDGAGAEVALRPSDLV